MKNKLINALLIVIFLFIVLSVVGIMVLDGLAESVIQTQGSKGLGTDLKVERVHVGFFGDDSSVHGLTLANPEPFMSDDTPSIIKVVKANIEFGLMSLLDKEIEIPTVTVSGVEFHLQQIDGISNIETIIQHVSSGATPEPNSSGSRFTIGVLTIKDITVVARGKFTILDSEPVTAHIQEIVLKDIGTDSNAEVAIEAITSAVTQAIMQHLAEHPVEGFSKIAFTNVTDVINQLPVFKELGVGDVLQGGLDTVGKGVDDLLGGIGGLLDNEKDQ